MSKQSPNRSNCSPDLSPIENIWSNRKPDNQQWRSWTVEQRESCITPEWDNIPLLKLQQLVSWLPRCLQTDVIKRGDAPQWWTSAICYQLFTDVLLHQSQNELIFSWEDEMSQLKTWYVLVVLLQGFPKCGALEMTRSKQRPLFCVFSFTCWVRPKWSRTQHNSLVILSWALSVWMLKSLTTATQSKSTQKSLQRSLWSV